MFRSITSSLVLALFPMFAFAGCQADSATTPASTEDPVTLAELDQQTNLMGLFNGTAARLDDTDIPFQATRTSWTTIYESVDGDTPQAKIVNAATVMANAAAFMSKVEQLKKGELTDEEFNRYAMDLRANGSRIKQVDGILKNFADNTDFAKLVKSGSGDADAATLISYFQFFQRNIQGTTIERRVKVLQTLLEIKTDADEKLARSSPVPTLDEKKTEAILATLELMAGNDGYINRGDAERLLSVVPKMVEEIANKLIAEGYAQGMAELASHRFIYRRWVRRPNGFIGRRVNAAISSALSQATAQKVAAMQQASAVSQQFWEQGMTELAVHRYGLESEAPVGVWDSAPPLTTQDIESLVQTLTGSTLSSKITLANAASLKNANIESRLGKLEDVRAIMHKIELPDGIPIRDGLALVRAKLAGGKMPLPWGLSFRMTAGAHGDAVMIRGYREPCECRFDSRVAGGSCIITYAQPKKPADRRMIFKAPVAGGTTCNVENDCQSLFSSMYDSSGTTFRETYVPYACGFRFRDAATDAWTFYKLPGVNKELAEDPDEALDTAR